MILFDYTHPGKVPRLFSPMDFRSESYYLRLDQLPQEDAYFNPDWVLFRYEEWLEGGSAWLQAYRIHQHAEDVLARRGIAKADAVLVVGSDDPLFDDALGCALLGFGWRVKVAEVV